MIDTNSKNLQYKNFANPLYVYVCHKEEFTECGKMMLMHILNIQRK